MWVGEGRRCIEWRMRHRQQVVSGGLCRLPTMASKAASASWPRIKCDVSSRPWPKPVVLTATRNMRDRPATHAGLLPRPRGAPCWEGNDLGGRVDMEIAAGDVERRRVVFILKVVELHRLRLDCRNVRPFKLSHLQRRDLVERQSNLIMGHGRLGFSLVPVGGVLNAAHGQRSSGDQPQGACKHQAGGRH